MKQGPVLLSLVVVMHSTTLTAGSITLSSGNVKTAGNQVITGSNARAQATVDQRGSVVRLGSNTSAQVGDRGEVSLSKGVLLISSGEGFLRRPAVQVTTPQGDVTVRGSAIVAALPDGSVKMTCLEGSVRGDLGGQNMALNPGHLIVQRPEGTRDTVQVNLNALTHSSTLLDSASFKQPLPAAPEIRQEVAQQAQSLGATLTLSRNDSVSTQKITLGNATELKTAEVKSDGPGLLTRIFGGGTSSSNEGANSNAAGTTVQVQGANSSQAPTANVISASQVNSLRISGEVSGSNVFLASTGTSGSISTAGSMSQGAEGQLQRLTVTPNATTSSQLVLANGSTQQIVSQGGLTLTSNVNAMSGASLVKSGGGTLAISNAQTVQGATLNSGTLVLQGAAAQQFISGNLSVTGPGGATITPSGTGGVLTFQVTNGGVAPPASAP